MFLPVPSGDETMSSWVGELLSIISWYGQIVIGSCVWHCPHVWALSSLQCCAHIATPYLLAV